MLDLARSAITETAVPIPMLYAVEFGSPGLVSKLTACVADHVQPAAPLLIVLVWRCCSRQSIRSRLV